MSDFGFSGPPGPIEIDFDILPGLEGEPSPLQIYKALESQLKSADSPLKSGQFGIFAGTTTLHTRERKGSVDVRERRASMGGELVPSGRIRSDSSVYREAQKESELQELRENVEGLQREVEALNSEKVLLQNRVEEAEDTAQARAREAASAKREVSELKEQLHQAKEMWMKESARATRLRENLDEAESTIGDLNEALRSLKEESQKTERENKNLKHIFERSGVDPEASSLDAKPHFPEGESYFAPPSTSARSTSCVQQPPLRKAAIAGSMRELVSPLPTLQSAPLHTRSNPGGSLLTQRALGEPSEGKGAPPPLNEAGFRKLCLANHGVLYENEVMQVGVRSSFPGLGEGIMTIFFGNKLAAGLQALEVKYVLPDGAEEEAFSEADLVTMQAGPLPSDIGPKQQVSQQINVQVAGPFRSPLLIELSFLLPDNTPNQLTLQLPIVISKFMRGRELTSSSDFFRHWRDDRFHLSEQASVVFLESHLTSSFMALARTAGLGGALQLHHGVDPNPDNLVLVGQFPADSEEGIKSVSIPESLALVRVEIGSDSHKGKARVAVRSDNPHLARAVRDCMVALISARGGQS